MTDGERRPDDHEAETSDLLAEKPAAPPLVPDAPTAMPSRIGRYTIKSFIAAGGMSAVYLAVQEQPHRTVALKLMKRGIASRSALRRFEFESQVLGRLHHPNIAQVYEAGTHDDASGSVPYFAMEYIPNAKLITEYARIRNLGTRQRLALFAKVCAADLHERVQRGTYRAQPSKRVCIPKPDGRKRPLGIASLEDKIVQQVVTTVLNQIYEEDFLGFSYGFRSSRSQHDALDALWVGIMGKRVNWVLDADIRGFFDTISHEWMLRFLEHRIADRRILRLVRKWLRAGVSEDGQWSKSEVGTPQGAAASPLLANVYLHYVFDLWAQQWRQSFAKGDVIIVRYADDVVMGFQYRGEAARFLKDLGDRVAKFGLALHPEKTRLIEFGRFAAENRRKRGDGKPETFDFLGFKHICGAKRWGKGFVMRRKTVPKRLRAKLKEVRQTLHRCRHLPVPTQGAWLRRVVQGYFNYHAIPGNGAALETFRTQAARAWLHSLRRRSQRHRMSREQSSRLVDRWIPRVRYLHPYPNQRFYAKHPR